MKESEKTKQNFSYTGSDVEYQSGYQTETAYLGLRDRPFLCLKICIFNEKGISAVCH